MKMEKKKIYTINDNKTMGIKTLYLNEGKIRIRQGFILLITIVITMKMEKRKKIYH